MADVVVAQSLTKRFGKLTAVDDLSFSLEEGTITGFLGPNGAGKTTTLRMLLGLAAPTQGQALVFDRPYAELERPAHRVGAVLEASDFHPGRSGRNHLLTLARAAGIPDSRADDVLRLVELDRAAHRRVKGYSLGMRQRLGLAAALLGEPELLILDEPANGLDPEGVRWLRDFLRNFASTGRTVLISSHVLAEVAQTVDQVLIINRGTLVVESSLAQLTARVGGAVRVRTPEPQKLLAALRQAGIAATTSNDHSLLVNGTTSERVGDLAFAAQVPIHELAVEGSSLEEVSWSSPRRPTRDRTDQSRAAEDGPALPDHRGPARPAQCRQPRRRFLRPLRDHAHHQRVPLRHHPPHLPLHTQTSPRARRQARRRSARRAHVRRRRRRTRLSHRLRNPHGPRHPLRARRQPDHAAPARHLRRSRPLGSDRRGPRRRPPKPGRRHHHPPRL